MQYKTLNKFVKVMIVLIWSLILSETIVYSKTLLLYKGSEQGYGYSILLKYVAPALKDILEDYEIIDVESLNFISFDLNNYDLIVTCYYTPQMRDAKKYLEKLSMFLINGGKLFIINNLGATLDSSGENHPGLYEINSVYNLLGLSYYFGWRKVKPSTININENFINTTLLKFENERDVERYTPISTFIKTLVELKDQQGNTYNMAFLSPLGGLIAYNYLFDDDGKIVLDLQKIFSNILIGNDEEFKILVVGQDNYELRKALDYTSFKYQWKKQMSSVLSTYDLVFHFGGSYPPADKNLVSYLSNGGTAVIIGKGSNLSFVDYMTVSDEVFPVPANLKFNVKKNISWEKPPQNSKVLVTSSNGEALVWSIPLGNGTVIFYPIELVSKTYRGLLMQSALSQLKVSIQPIVNSWSMHLDDFPLPAYKRKIDIITREFGDITDNEFYYNIWWPMMKQLSKEFSIKYTTIFVANYNASVTWPFSFQEYTNTPEQMRALQELISSSYEIGLHGYNHIHLTQENWKPENLETVLKLYKTFLKNTLGDNYIPYVYVAPNNIIDSFGVEELLRTFPSIKVIGTSYTTTQKLFDEFEVIHGKVVVMPRTTFGYYPAENLLASSILSLMTFGTFQYFLHPDDLFSKDRNPDGKTWKEMYNSLREFLSTMTRYYPFLRNHTASESGEILYDFLTQKPIIRKFANKLSVEIPIGHHLPRFYYLRVRGAFSIYGGRIVYSYGNLVVIEQLENKMEIILK
ncbi:MAG: DUF2194 domain-containing protein [Fervidobacterium sp.]|uniref:DUF2194 domain-containing protein n=1 Tax=Fervidobacterium TaxID=2422 RepID=UPI0030A724D2